MSRGRILVTDDESALAHVVGTNLRYEGFEVVTACDGVECLEKVTTHRPDLVVLDLLMPRKSGWEVLTELRAEAATRDLPVIVLSVMQSQETMERAKQFGKTHFLAKPFEPGELVAIVNRLVTSAPGT